jgi:hypothetical protein
VIFHSYVSLPEGTLKHSNTERERERKKKKQQHRNIPSGNITQLLKLAIGIVDLPIKNGGSFHSFFVNVYQRVQIYIPGLGLKMDPDMVLSAHGPVWQTMMMVP